MSQTAIIGVTVLMLCCSSSVGAFFLIPSEEAALGPTPGPTPGPSPGPSAPVLPSGQYVKLVHTVAYDANAKKDNGTTEGDINDKNKVLNLAELEVFAPSGTTNLAAGRTVTGNSQHSATHGFINLVDGNMTNFAHTKGRGATELDFLQVDLGSVQEIGKIKITNRTTCCKKRAVGIKAQIIGSDGTTVVKETPAISTTADTYTFTFPGTAWA